MSELLVTSIYNQEGEGAPNFPKGATVTGVITATSFSGSGANLSGIDATALKDGGGSVKIQANSDGATVTGVLTATTGSFTGNVSVGGTLTYEDVTNIDAVGLITARSGINVTSGDIDISSGNIKVGTATTIDNSGVNVTGVITATSFDGNGANLTNLPPGGNTVSLVADGSIAVGKCIQLRTDGKVEQVVVAVQASQPGSPTGPENWVSSGNNDNLGWSVTVVDPDADRAIVYFQGTSDKISFTNMAIYEPATDGGIGAQSQTFTQIGGNSEYTIDNNRNDWTACYDTTNNKHIVVWSDTTTAYLRFSVGTMSGTTLSFSTQSLIQSTPATKPQIVFDSATGRVILVCRRSDNWYPNCFIGSYNSGTSTYDWSSMTQLSANAMVDDIRICQAGTTTGQYAVFWRQNSNNYTKSNLITVSSSSNTFTNAGLDGIIDLHAYWIQAAYDANADRINLIYFNNSDSQMYIQRVKRKSGDSGLEVDGSIVNVSTQDVGQNIQIIYSPSALRCYTWWLAPNQSYSLRWKAITNTTGTVTLGSETAPPTNPTVINSRGLGFPDMYNPRGNIIYTVDRSSVNRGQMFSVKTTAEVSNRTVANHYLGFADQAYTDGQTATIKTYGNNSSDLSGLTIGSKYYVQNDGTVATSTASPSALAGLAISATKLLIMEPKADV